MHLLLSPLLPIIFSIAPFLNLATPVQADSVYTIAAPKPAKPVACGKNWGCFQKAVAACKPATLKQIVTDTDQGILATETNRYAITGKHEGRCDFSMTITGMTASFDPKTRESFIREARASGIDPNKIIKDATKMLRPFIGKKVTCAIAPDDLKSLVERAQYHYPDMHPGDWENYGCTGTLLEEQTSSTDAPVTQQEPDPVVAAWQRKDCANIIRQNGTPIISSQDVSSVLGGSWNIPSINSGRVMVSCDYSMARGNETGEVIIQELKDKYYNIFRDKYLEHNGKTFENSSYGAVPGLGDEAFYIKRATTDRRAMSLFIRKGARKVWLSCGPLCTDEQQIELGRLLISRWPK